MSIDKQAFLTPGAEYRGAPFWSLNHDLTDHDRLRSQIDAFEDMGLGGFHLHVRAGLKTDYLGPEFLEAVSLARDYGKSKGMLSYLYDEDTWPSGFAGGAVTSDHAFRQRWILIQKGRPNLDQWSSLLTAYEIHLDDNGYLKSYKQIDHESASDDDWFITKHIAPDNDRFNGAAYLDVLNPEAVDAFIESTHEVYRKQFGGHFPDDVPAIFTDEPQIARLQELAEADKGFAKLAWTDDFPETFELNYQVNIWSILPEIIWPKTTGPSAHRWQYHDHLSERFANAFADRIGNWCEKHGLASTGHLMGEENLSSQIMNVGEAMRHYRGFQIPGIDILCNRYEPSTAKQAVSVARQDGREGVLSELYGVTNWDFPFSGHKYQGDWQAALGITLRVHHLSWLSMEGQSKRDYPAAIGPQSPWYKEYKTVEDHFARVNVALKSGNPLVDIAVIHPVESGWLHRGVASIDGQSFSTDAQNFHNIVNWLLDDHIDFDFIAESLLPQQYNQSTDASLHVGNMQYKTVILPGLSSIRQSTLDILQLFIQSGGTVIVLGSVPNYCNGELSDAPQQVLKQAMHLPMQRAQLLPAIEDQRFFKVCHRNGTIFNPINHQIRQDGNERILFCCHRKQDIGTVPPWGAPHAINEIRIRGHWQVYELDTSTGQEYLASFTQTDQETIVPWKIEAHSHRLLRLKPGSGENDVDLPNWQVLGNCPEPHQGLRSEENVLLLDMPEWSVDGEAWQAAQDSLTTQLQLAERFGWPDWAQPYSVKNKGDTHIVKRRFQIHTEIDLSNVRLMCERLHDATIIIDGNEIEKINPSFWIDQDLTCCDLPTLDAGKHIIEISLPLNAVDRHLEWCYLLGDFHVHTQGAHATIQAKQTNVCWGDLSQQGFAFYGGNFIYRSKIKIDEAGEYAIRCPSFGGSLLRVACDGNDCGPVAYAPFRAKLGQLDVGEHDLEICAYGNRHNTFGALHNADPQWRWWGPQAWRRSDVYQNDIWQLKSSGVTRAPILERLMNS